MTLLLAEELLLLALDPERGTPVNSSRTPLTAALPGALVAELGLLGAVDVQGRRFVPVPGVRVDDPLLAEVHDLLGSRRGRRSADQLRRLERSVKTWRRLVDRLCDEKVLGRRRDRVLLWHVTRHPVLDAGVRDEVLARLRAAAAGDAALDVRTATVLALVGPARLLEVVAPDRAGRRHAKQRIKEATDQSPVAPVVKRVIAEAAAAAASAATVAVAASS